MDMTLADLHDPRRDLAEPAPRLSRRLVAWVATSVVGIGVAGYLVTGNPGLAYLTLASAAPSPQVPAADPANDALVTREVDAMVATLAARLARTPDDADGWQMLARSYSALGRAAEAVPAYERALALRGNDAALLADAADAVALRNQGRANAASDALVARALAIDAAQPKALALAGTSAFERADYAAAIGYWERMLKVVPAVSPDVAWLRDNIAEARRRAG